MIYLVIVLNANRMCGKTSRFCSLFNETYYTGFTVFGVGAARMINAYWSVSQASLTRSTQRSFVMRTAHESSPHPTGSFTLMKLLWDIIPTANATRLRTRARHCDSRVITNCNLVIKFYNGSEISWQQATHTGFVWNKKPMRILQRFPVFVTSARMQRAEFDICFRG